MNINPANSSILTLSPAASFSQGCRGSASHSSMAVGLS